MEIATAIDFARQHRRGVLVTMKRDGRPQLSNVAYGVGDDGVVRISITADRAKYHNAVRDQRVSLHVARDDFYAYAVIDGDAAVSAVAADADDATVDELVALYRIIAGEHGDWHEYRAAMVSDRRAVLRLSPTHAYGMLPS